MRAIVLASTALVLALPACDARTPAVSGDPVLALSLANPKQCRDPRGRFAKCQDCPDGSRIWAGATCPVPTPPILKWCAGGIQVPETEACPTKLCPDNVTVVKVEEPCPVVKPDEPTPAPLPEPAPTPTPDPVDPVPEPSPTLGGLPPIASNFSVANWLEPASVPGTAAPDHVGAFRFICQAGQLLRDDPIVYPGQPGKSHLHQFYGNTGANANSTYESLRTTGDSTCMNPLNRSAYWIPAMLDGKGNVVRPSAVAIYYKRRPISDPKCSLTSGDPKAEGNCVELPNGLKFIFGYDMITGKAPTGSFDYIIMKDGNPASSPFKTMAQLAASGLALPGMQVWVRGHAPSCWNGKDIDSPNHRDHVAYKSYGSWGYAKCPSTHPYVIPDFFIATIVDIAAGDDLTLWRLSSDDHAGGENGSTFHADFWMAWDPATKKLWHDNCINKLLSCSAGVLGNGQIMKRWSGYSYVANPRLVPVPGS